MTIMKNTFILIITAGLLFSTTAKSSPARSSNDKDLPASTEVDTAIAKYPGFIGSYIYYPGTVYSGWGLNYNDSVQVAFPFGIYGVVNSGGILNGLTFQETISRVCTRYGANQVYGVIWIAGEHGSVFNQPSDTALYTPNASAPGMVQAAHRFSRLSKIYPQITGVILDDFYGLTSAQLFQIREALRGKSLDANGVVVDSSPETTPDLKLFICYYQSCENSYSPSIDSLIDGVNLWVDNNQDLNYVNLAKYIDTVRQKYPGTAVLTGADLTKGPAGIDGLIASSDSLYELGKISGMMLFQEGLLCRQYISQSRWDSLAMPPLLDSLYYPYLGQVAGKVVDTGGNPVPNARVTLERIADGDTIVAARKYSDASGQYSFSGWAGKNTNITYQVVVEAPTYGTSSVNVQLQGQKQITLLNTITSTKKAGNSPPTTPVLTSPASGSSIDPAIAESFKWGASTDPDGDTVSYTYSLTGARDTTIAAKGTSVSLPAGYLPAGSSFSWNVTASDGSLTAASSEWSFTTAVPIPGSPSVTAPVDSSVNQPTSVTVAWTNVANALHYTLELSRDSTFASTDLDTTVSNTGFNLSGLKKSQLYFLRVNAGNGSGTGPWSGRSRFTTVANQPPAVPVLASPANGSTINANVAETFRWNASTDPDSNHVYYVYKMAGARDTTISTNDTSVTIPANYLSRGASFTWSVAASDSSLTSTSAAFSGTTNPDGVPAVTARVPDVNVIENSGRVLLSSDVRRNITDPDGDNLSYTVSSSNGITVTLSNDSLFAIPVSGFTGTAYVYLKGTDPFGSSAYDTSIVIVSNAITALPRPNLLSPGSGSLTANPVNYSWHECVACDHSIVGYKLNIVGPTDTTIVTPDSSLSISGLRRGSYLCFVYATSSTGLSSVSDTSRFSVMDNAPTQNRILSVTDSVSLPEGNVVVVSSSSIDIDGDSLTYCVYAQAADGSSDTLITSPDTVITIPGTLFRTGVYTISERITDGLDTVSTVNSWTNTITTDVHDISGGVSKSFELHQNYPNPFNPTTNISYDIPRISKVTLKVYDVLGRQVATLVNGERTPGQYQVTFDGADLPSGVYFYRLTAGSYTSLKKLVLLK